MSTTESALPNLFQRMLSGLFAEIDAQRTIEGILGLEWDSLAGLSWDYYDESFEIYAPEDVLDIVVTDEQHTQILALGCSRYWINFADGTERYCRGASQSSAFPRWRKFDEGLRFERREMRDAQGVIDALRVELREQARLLGMGGEREAALLAKVDTLVRENERVRADLVEMIEGRDYWMEAARKARRALKQGDTDEG